jgi:hypothetical protein
VPVESTTDRRPFRVPDVVGVNTTATVHPDEAANEPPHVVAEILKSPVTEPLCIAAATPPVFETVTFCAELDDPSVTVPKLRLAGSSTMFAGARPLPLSVAVACCPETLPFTVRTPDRGPAADGEKTICTMQALPVP